MRLNRIIAWAVLPLALLTLFALGQLQLTSLRPATAQSSRSSHIPPDEFYQLVRPNASVVRSNTVVQTSATLPDLDVQYIDRTPRYKWCDDSVMNCSGVKLWPSAGEAVNFEGRIANRGSAASGAFTYTWYIFGRATNGSHDIRQLDDQGSGTVAVKIVAGNKVGVVFLDVTAFNLAYWRGSTGQAIYPLTFAHWVTTSTPHAPACRFLPLIQQESQTSSAASPATGAASAAYPPPPTPDPYPRP